MENNDEETPPAFDPNVAVKVDAQGQETPPVFDRVAAQPQVGYGESALRGAGQGFTLGYSDELAGFLDGAVAKYNGGDFSDAYRKGQLESEARNKAAQKANPNTYFGGSVAGTIASAVIPGVAPAKGVGILGNAVRAGVGGTLYGAGTSEGNIDDLKSGSQLVKDAAIGGVTGFATQGLLSGAKKSFKPETLANYAASAEDVGKTLGSPSLKKFITNPISTPKDMIIGNMVGATAKPAYKAGMVLEKVANKIPDVVKDNVTSLYDKSGGSIDLNFQRWVEDYVNRKSNK